MEIQKILWPTDFSRSAEKALPTVKSLTERYKAEIHVLYVIEDTARHEPWYGEFDEERVQQLLERAKKTAAQRLEQICNKYLEGCPMYIRHVDIGDPAQRILSFIDSASMDMVVMATRGDESHFPFGSVTEKVVKNATIPVVTVPIPDE